MIEQFPPLLVIPSFELAQAGKSRVMVKGFISSMQRSLFSGRIAVFRNRQTPMFKVERRALDEVFAQPAEKEECNVTHWELTIKFLSGLCSYVKPEPRQWLIVADARSVALRNTDHLIPPDMAGSYGPPEVDLYWAAGGRDEVTPGLWAVRSEHLPAVLTRWEKAWSLARNGGTLNEIEVWTRVVRELPLRKRAFEKGEVVAPRIGAVDWEAVSNAAFVTVPDWPEKEAWKFLQALYFGTYLGDETGMMLNILEA
jgi:hypothetical protein